ncbi:MAG: CpaF family protein [Candidatus Omnitrophica bacterium]|nr:CpaF family protein [Candidatus Omnitrophota bacterium]
MEIANLKKMIRREISMLVDQEGKTTREIFIQRANQIFENMDPENKEGIDSATKDKIIVSLCDDFLGLGPLQRLMNDKEVTEIMINGPDKIYIEKSGKKGRCNIKFDDETHLRYIIEKMIAPASRRVDESSPYVDFSLADGSRVNIILPPLAIKGATVTIRKFLDFIQSADDLVRMGTIDSRMAEFLKACIKAKVNILFSGATGSGKTTTLEVLSSYINPDERIITIEDALELKLRQEHVVSLLTRPSNIEGKGEVSPRELFRNTLRMRPTRIILGEVRGEEALDYLQALNSGHRGSLAVIHASIPADALSRLETMALYAGINFPAWAVRNQISSGLDLIVQQSQLSDGSRKITHITEVGKMKDNQVELRDIFCYEIEKVLDDSSVKGKFKAVNVPEFMPIFKKMGVKIDENIFKE